MKKKMSMILLIGFGVMLGQFGNLSFEVNPVNAEEVGLSAQGNDALWHLPKFAEVGWFVHASNGRVRACNLDKVSVIGDKAGPRCTNWE